MITDQVLFDTLKLFLGNKNIMVILNGYLVLITIVFTSLSILKKARG